MTSNFYCIIMKYRDFIINVILSIVAIYLIGIVLLYACGSAAPVVPHG